MNYIGIYLTESDKFQHNLATSFSCFIFFCLKLLFGLAPDSPTPPKTPKFKATHQESGTTYKLKPTPCLILDPMFLCLNSELNKLSEKHREKQEKYFNTGTDKQIGYRRRGCRREGHPKIWVLE